MVYFPVKMTCVFGTAGTDQNRVQIHPKRSRAFCTSSLDFDAERDVIRECQGRGEEEEKRREAVVLVSMGRTALCERGLE